MKCTDCKKYYLGCDSEVFNYGYEEDKAEECEFFHKVNKRQICYRIITYTTIIIGIDASKLTDDDILLSINKLLELSFDKLLDLEQTLYTIYYELSNKEEE